MGYAFSSTEVRFDNGFEATLERRAVSGALEYQALEWMSLRASVGVALTGDLSDEREQHDLGAGPFGQLGASFTVVDGRDDLPFVVLGITLSSSHASAVERRLADAPSVGFTALDLRASAALGKLFWNTLGPYLGARAFGGPIWWQQDGVGTLGTDRYKYQFGAGALVTTGRLDAFFEVAPFGERAATFGAAGSF